MTQLAFEGSRLWLFVALAGGLSLFWRYRRDRKNKPEATLWPSVLAEGGAWLILTLFLLQPVVLRRTFRFHAPEILIAVDRSQSFLGGQTLGLDSLVNAGVEAIKRKAGEKDVQVRVWDFAGGVRKPDSKAPIQDGQTRFDALAEAIVVQGMPFRSVILISDGHANPKQQAMESDFQTPVFPLRLPLGRKIEAQPIAAEWIRRENARPEKIRVHWMPSGSGARGMRTCLIGDGKVAECWERSAEAALSAWGQQEHDLNLSASSRSLLANGKQWALTLIPIPTGGDEANDTLRLAHPEGALQARVCWPEDVRSLDETAALRALAAESLTVIPSPVGDPCLGGIRAVRWDGLASKGGAASLRVAAPTATDPSGPYRNWRHFADTSSLSYAGQGRNLLPPAMGRLSDISGGLYLPLARDMAGCALEVGSGPQAGCLVGWLRSAPGAKDSGPVAFLALPKTWERLFREEGDAALWRRLVGLMKGSLELARLGQGGSEAAGTPAPFAEMQWLGVDQPALTALAARSGGGWCDWSALNTSDTVSEVLPWLGRSSEEIGSPQQERLALRFGWPWFCAVVGLLAFAWFWRKRLFLG